MRNKKRAVLFSLLALAVLSAIFLGGAAVGAIYRGELADAWRTLRYERHVKLEHGNLLSDGAGGFVRDLDRRLHLPEELYVGGDLQIAFDSDGQIEYIYAYLQGTDQKGRLRQYYVNYDRANSEKMTVRLDPWYSNVIREEDRLSPLFALADAMDLKNRLAGPLAGGLWQLEYGGADTFYPGQTPEYLPGDADGDGVQSGVTDLDGLSGGHVTGFAASLISPEGERWSYIMEPVYTSAEQLRAEREAEAVAAAKADKDWMTDDSDGTMYFFLDGETGWRLVITDAALGSRFYVMERTQDGGESWERINDDPFDGNIGVAEGLIFFDSDLGFAGLAWASQDHSRLYVTRDGGRNFEAVELPMDTVTEMPGSGQEPGFSAADYDYCMMPERSGNTLSILVVPANGERDGLTFRSEDDGMSWATGP